MVEILSTLSMDIDTLRAALLFPLADGEVVSEEVMQESVGKSVVTLIHGVRDMAAIRQLKATHTDSVSSEQVDNIRRMLLAMVDDFRCVVIKLAERIAHLREVKDAPEDERVLAAKECTNIYAPGEPLRYRPAGSGSWKITASAICIRRNTSALPNCSTSAVSTASITSKSLSATCAQR